MDIELSGRLGHVGGIWEKVRSGSNEGFGVFGVGFKKRVVIGGIYWRTG